MEDVWRRLIRLVCSHSVGALIEQQHIYAHNMPTCYIKVTICTMSVFKRFNQMYTYSRCITMNLSLLFYGKRNVGFLSGLEYLNNVSATHNAFVWQRKRINSEHKHTNALEWIDVIDIDLIWHALPNMQMAYQLKLNQFSKLRLFCEWICYIHVFVYGYGYNNINSI